MKRQHIFALVVGLVLAMLCGRVFVAGVAQAEEGLPAEQENELVPEEEQVSPNQETSQKDSYESQVVVTYAEDVPLLGQSAADGEADEVYRILDEEVISDESIIEGEGVTSVVTVECSSDVSLEDVMNRMIQDPAVLYVQRNYQYHLPIEHEPDSPRLEILAEEGDGLLEAQASTDDTYGYLQHYLRPWNYSSYGNLYFGANAADAWDVIKTNKTVEVAVIDTGCLPKHEDLAANLDMTYAKDVVADTPAGKMSDSDGHGTHVCGIVGAVANNGKGVAGVSYNAKVLPIKVFDEDGASTIDIIEALDYLITLKRTGKLPNLHVINMSLCVYPADYDPPVEDEYDRAMHERIKTLRNSYNVLTVCAGGNGDAYDRPRTNTCYPSDWAECMSVTALTEDGENVKWSDYNAAKDISAPGMYIFSTSGKGTSEYEYEHGTSMSSPIVAGTAALLWAAVPNLTVSQAVTCIRATANKLSPTGANYHPQSGSAGAVDADAAVRYAIEHYGTRTDIAGCAIASVSSHTYTGSAIMPKPKVTYDGRTLKAGTDFTFSYSNNVNVGTATITVSGKGIFKGKATRTFKIVKASINVADCAAVADRKYTGNPIRPRPVVTYKGRTLSQFVDYTLSYANNTQVGTGWIYITGKGNFSGTLYASFVIAKYVVFKNPFADVNTATAHYSDILWLAEQDITQGWLENDGTRTFRPNASIKRGDMAAFLYRLADNWGLIADDWEPKEGTNAFVDVNTNTSHAHEIWWLAEMGISEGWKVGSKREFRPNAEVKRGDMAAFLFRLAKLAKRGGASDSWKPAAEQLAAFVDVDGQTSHRNEIAWLAATSISEGWAEADGTRTYRPNVPVKRGDMAAFLHRLDGLS